MFWQKKSPLLGVDISASVIKVIELGHSDGAYIVEAYSAVPLPHGAIVDGTIENTEQVSEVLRAAVKKAATKIKNVAAALPSNSVITKTLTLPVTLAGQELEETVMIQAANYIPYPLEEVRLDFEETPWNIDTEEPENNNKSVLLVAARSENVDKRVEVMEQAGLKLKVIDVESYCVEAANNLVIDQLPSNNQKNAIAVVEVGANRTSVNVLLNGKTIFSREQSFGGRLLTEQIEQYYGFSYEEAGRAKKHGGLPDGYEQNILEPFKKSLAQMVNRLLEFFYAATTNSNHIDHLILTGGCSAIEGVDKVVEESTGVMTSIANPFANMKISSKVNKQALMNDAAAMMVACGLALRGFD